MRDHRVLIGTILFSFLLMVVLASRLDGRPTIRRAFFNAYPTAVGSRLDNLPSHSTHCRFPPRSRPISSRFPPVT